MLILKRSPWNLFKGLLSIAATGAIAWFIADFFFDPLAVKAGITAICVLVLAHTVFLSENIRIELDGSVLRYYQRGKLRQQFPMNEYLCRYQVRSERGLLSNSDISLYIAPADGLGQEIYIDCSPLGLNRFYRFYDALERQSATPITKLETIKS